MTWDGGASEQQAEYAAAHESTAHVCAASYCPERAELTIADRAFCVRHYRQEASA